MDRKDAFKERERSLEERYFRAQDARLVEKLQDRAALGEVAAALKEKLEVDDPALLEEIRGLGVTVETGAAFLMAPVVQVAWAEGKVTKGEREAVLALAAERGIEPGTPAYEKLGEWLQQRPPDELFDTALATIKAGLSVLTPPERAERMKRIVDACRHVARASGGLPGLFGMGGQVSWQESDMLEAITKHLRVKPDPGI